jgi:vitamin B12 transporter
VSRLFVGCLVAGAAARSARADTIATSSAPDGGLAADAVLPEVEVPVQSAAELPIPPKDPKDETGQVTRIDARGHAGEAISTAELIAAAPGAQIHRLGDEGQQATVQLRGSSTDQILVLLDGIPLTSAAGGSVDLSTIPAGLIDHVDVLRGDAAARYGAGALGGVVNVVTRKTAANQGEVEASYGSWNTVSASGAGGVAIGPASGSLGLSFFRSDGDFPYQYSPTPDLPVPSETLVRQNNQSLVMGAVGAVSGRVASGTAEAVAQGSFVDRGLAGDIYFLTPHDHDTDGRGLFGVSWTRPQLLGPFDLTVLGHARAEELDVTLAEPGSTHQLDLDATAEVALAGTLGFQRLSLSASGGDESLSSNAGSPSRGTFGAGAADRIALFKERLFVVPAVRLEEVGPFFGASPKLGVSFFPWGPLELRANAGHGFRAPTFGELYLQQGIAQPNPGLQPETNWSLDWAGVLRLGRLWLSVGGFLSSYDNLILYELYPPEAAKPFNEGASVVQGFESELVARPLPGFEIGASYTFLDAYDNDPTSYTYGRELPYKAQNHAHGRASWHYRRLALGLEADLASGQTLNRAATLSIPGHALIDASIGFRLFDRPAVWLTAGGKNLVNSQAPDSFGYPLPSTSFSTSLRVSEVPQGAVQ